MTCREQAERIASQRGVALESGGGFASLWPLVEHVGDEGAVFIIKLDGERDASAEPRYTLLLSGEHVGRLIRRDTSELEEGIAEMICEYASRCWGITMLGEF